MAWLQLDKQVHRIFVRWPVESFVVKGKSHALEDMQLNNSCLEQM